MPNQEAPFTGNTLLMWLEARVAGLLCIVPSEESAMAVRSAAGKATATRKAKKEPGVSAPSAPLEETLPKTGDLHVRSHLEKGISELQGLHKLLLSNEVDPDVLADFRDALNRIRNTAWAAQQYIVRKESGQDSASVLSLLAGERIRVAYQLCQGLSDDLKGSEVEFQRGSLVQLYEVAKTLTETLKHVIDNLR